MEQRLSEVVIGCAIEVHRTLGHGFLERVYELALAIEFRHAGLTFERQKSLPVSYGRSEQVFVRHSGERRRALQQRS